MRRSMRKNSLVVLSVIFLLFCGCTYYNTFYNAKKSFKEGEKIQEKATGTRRASAGQTQYETAIKKASKILTFHPKSKWADDALFLIGRAYFNMEEYIKAKIKFEELLASFPKSKLVDDSRYYISLCHYYTEEEVLAIKQLKDFLESKKMGKKKKAQASYLLGQIYHQREEYDNALTFYQKTLEEFDPDTLSAITQLRIGECLWEEKDYEKAKQAFIQVEKYKPSSEILFESQFKQGECWFVLGDFQKGMRIYKELLSDERFTAKQASVKLKIAEGYYHMEEIAFSMMEYEEITEMFARTEESSQAYFKLGEIYEDIFDDLPEAKKMYETCSAEKRGAPVANEAMSRSANIARIEEYYKEMSEEETQKSGRALFLLGELYLTQMDEPDSALAEYLALVRQIPESEYAPKSLYAAAWITENIKKDSVQAAELYLRIMDEYPQSDYLKLAREFLNTSSDSLEVPNPEETYLQAERLLFEEGEVDSAFILYDFIIKEFPNSGYAVKSAFAKAWTIEYYANPGDSTAIFAYQSVVEQYPESEYAEEARIRLGLSQRTQPTRPEAREAVPIEYEPDSTTLAQGADTTAGPQFPRAPIPLRKGDFIYPESEIWTNIQGAVVLKIRIDYDGTVSEADIINSLDNIWIDEAAKEAALNTVFNPESMDMVELGGYFIYSVEVRPPQDDPLTDPTLPQNPYEP
jgi:TonB family protein